MKTSMRLWVRIPFASFLHSLYKTALQIYAFLSFQLTFAHCIGANWLPPASWISIHNAIHLISLAFYFIINLFFFLLLAKSDRDRYITRIKNIRSRCGLNVSYQEVTREEKDLIVKAMGLTQGHWFKCPKGRHKGKYFFPNVFHFLAEHATVYETPKEHASGLITIQFSLFLFFFLTAITK